MPTNSHLDQVLDAVQKISEASSSNAMNPYLEAARWIPIVISPFLNIRSVLWSGFKDDEESEPIVARQYAQIMKMVPQFTELMQEFMNREDEGGFEEFVDQMTNAMNNARSEDTATLKHSIGLYIPITSTEFLMPPLQKVMSKARRGFSHPIIAKLLCPLKHLDVYEENPKAFRDAVEAGTVKLRARQWPSFLYPHDAVYDPENIDKGLFRGHIFGRVLRHILTGPTSALELFRTANRPSKSELHGLTKIIGEIVAYTATQTYFSLCTQDNWCTSDKYFKLEDFHTNIVTLFADAQDEWVIDTLAYLTKQVPSLNRKNKRKIEEFSSEEDMSDEDSTGGIMAQRERRYQAAKAVQAAVAAEALTTLPTPEPGPSTSNTRQPLPNPASPQQPPSRPSSPMSQRSPSPQPVPPHPVPSTRQAPPSPPASSPLQTTTVRTSERNGTWLLTRQAGGSTSSTTLRIPPRLVTTTQPQPAMDNDEDMDDSEDRRGLPPKAARKPLETSSKVRRGRGKGRKTK